MKSSPAGKGKDLLHDCAAGRFHFRLYGGEISCIDYDQRPSGRYRIFLVKAAREAAIFKTGVVRAVVGEFPSEDAGIERLDLGDVQCRKLDVVYPAFVRLSVHQSSMRQDS